MAKRRHSVPKIAIIKAVEAGDKSKSEVVKLLDIPNSSLSSILKNNSEKCFVHLRSLPPGSECIKELMENWRKRCSSGLDRQEA
jgi:hypothetical protein